MDARVTIRLTDGERDLWQQAAGGELVPLGRWVRQVVNAHVRTLSERERLGTVAPPADVLPPMIVPGPTPARKPLGVPTVRAGRTDPPDDNGLEGDVEYEPFEETP